MTYGSESECATHYTTAPHEYHCSETLATTLSATRFQRPFKFNEVVVKN